MSHWCRYACAYIHVKAREQPWVLLLGTLSSSLETRCLMFRPRLDWLANKPMVAYPPISPALGLQECIPTFGIFMWVLGIQTQELSNSGTQTCMSSTLLSHLTNHWSIVFKTILVITNIFKKKMR